MKIDKIEILIMKCVDIWNNHKNTREFMGMITECGCSEIEAENIKSRFNRVILEWNTTVTCNGWKFWLFNHIIERVYFHSLGCVYRSCVHMYARSDGLRPPSLPQIGRKFWIFVRCFLSSMKYLRLTWLEIWKILKNKLKIK